MAHSSMDGFPVLIYAQCQLPRKIKRRQSSHKIMEDVSNDRVTTPSPLSVDTAHNNNKLYKVIVVGNSSVGKSSFIFRYIHGKFSSFQPTLGVDFSLKKIEIPEKGTVRLQIWDIAGQERFGSLTKLYYRKASACIIMFDVSEAKSFRDVRSWKDDVDGNVTLTDGRPIPCILLGNKTDLPNRCVQDEDIKNYCKENSFVGWSTMSVKDNVNIEEPMMFLVEKLLLNESNSSSMCNADIFTNSDGLIKFQEHESSKSPFCCSR